MGKRGASLAVKSANLRGAPSRGAPSCSTRLSSPCSPLTSQARALTSRGAFSRPDLPLCMGCRAVERRPQGRDRRVVPWLWLWLLKLRLLLLLLWLEVAQAWPSAAGRWRSHLQSNAFPHSRLLIPEQTMHIAFTGVGCILVPKRDERDHYIANSAILVVEHHDEQSAGVILDRPAAVTLGDCSPMDCGPFRTNPVFIGGKDGGDLAIVLHSQDLGGMSKYLGFGLFAGGLGTAIDKVSRCEAQPQDFKFILNYVTWRPGELAKELSEGRWEVCVAPPALALSQSPEHFGRLSTILRAGLPGT